MKLLFKLASYIKTKVRFLELKLISSIAAFFGSASVANEIYKKLNVVETPKQVKAEANKETIKEPSPLVK